MAPFFDEHGFIGIVVAYAWLGAAWAGTAALWWLGFTWPASGRASRVKFQAGGLAAGIVAVVPMYALFVPENGWRTPIGEARGLTLPLLVGVVLLVDRIARLRGAMDPRPDPVDPSPNSDAC